MHVLPHSRRKAYFCSRLKTDAKGEQPHVSTKLCNAVCTYQEVSGTANLKELAGSAFFMTSRGLFLTARHVIEYAFNVASKADLQVGLVVKGQLGWSEKSFIAKVLTTENAPSPSDVAIGLADYRGDTAFSLEDRNVEVWQDVATYGYPLNAVGGDPEALRWNIRCHKGYIQRLVDPRDSIFGPSPPGFELSFLLSRGLSGAPLFIANEPKHIVIGVCVGSMKCETIEHEHVEVLEGGETYREQRLSIEQFGLAHDLRPLHGWQPELLDGKNLFEAVREP